MAWVIVLSLAAIIGFACAYLIKNRWSMVLAGALPWITLLTWLIYRAGPNPSDEVLNYLVIIQAVMGTVAAITGLVVYRFTKKMLFSKSPQQHKSRS